MYRSKICHSSWSSFKFYFSGKGLAPTELEVTANPEENEQDPEEGNLPEINPKEAIMRTHSGLVVKPTRNQDFEYSFMLPCTLSLSPSMSSFLEAHLHSVHSSTCSLEENLQHVFSSSIFNFNSNSCVPLLVQNHSVMLSHTLKARIWREKLDRLEQLGQQVYWVFYSGTVELISLLYKPSGMLYNIDLEFQDWTSAFDATTFTHVQQRGEQWLCPPPARKSIKAEVEFPRTL